MKKNEFERQKEIAEQIGSGKPRNFELYAQINEQALLAVPDTHQLIALVDGYRSALTYHRVYSPSLFLKDTQLISYLQNVVKNSPTFDVIRSCDQELYMNCLAILEDNSEIASVFIGYIKTAFIHGYKLALHDAQVYDDCLFLEREELMNCIFADLLSRKDKQEKARKAQDRIVKNKYDNLPT